MVDTVAPSSLDLDLGDVVDSYRAKDKLSNQDLQAIIELLVFEETHTFQHESYGDGHTEPMEYIVKCSCGEVFDQWVQTGEPSNQPLDTYLALQKYHQHVMADRMLPGTYRF